MWLTTWNYIVGWVRQESAAATAIVQAFIALGIAFAWWNWSTAQTGAVIGIVAALLGMFVRSQVTPIHHLRDRVGPTARPVHEPGGGPATGPVTRPMPTTGPAPGPAGGEPGGQR